MSLLMVERTIIVIAGHIGLVIDVNVSVYVIYRLCDATAAMLVYQKKYFKKDSFVRYANIPIFFVVSMPIGKEWKRSIETNN